MILLMFTLKCNVPSMVHLLQVLSKVVPLAQILLPYPIVETRVARIFFVPHQPLEEVDRFTDGRTATKDWG